MAETPPKKSIALERQIIGYANPKTFALFIGYKISEDLGKSEALNVILRDFFQRMPEEKLKKYLKEFQKFQSENAQLSKGGATWPV